jgi:hypothetical protein
MSDPCECLFSHEALMRRLLSALRDTQADCTDNECEDPSGTGGGDNGFGLPMLLALWGIAALVLFLARPSSMRNSGGDRQTDEKQRIHQVSIIRILKSISLKLFNSYRIQSFKELLKFYKFNSF